MAQDTPSQSTDSSTNSIGTLITIAVGNTRTRVGSFIEKECLNPQSFASDAVEEIAQRIKEITESLLERDPDYPTIVLAGVHSGHADSIERAVRDATNLTIFRFGRDFQIPIHHTLTETGEMTVGQDRLLCALGAFDMLGEACVVIDAGTAVTVDFVDGTGVFHGGAIMPGISMMLSSLHDTTANLPKITYHKVDPSSNEPAKQTDEAIILGVTYAVRGAVHTLTERYAEHYMAYPKTIVTGGDIGVFEGDELIDSFAPDLQLHGIRVACSQILADDEDEE